ncbi:hypothetical protein LCGC14_0001790 [marine sediment metagenome]|uniref:Uncharacterized protein n=1 Tax=marine sediment metagenome TaxID=412755 RepID=A0A0F9W4F6_9ZZZZ
MDLRATQRCHIHIQYQVLMLMVVPCLVAALLPLNGKSPTDPGAV